MNSSLSIIIGSDHAGLSLKSGLVLHLSALGYTVLDMGTNSTESCDYPLIAQKVCTEVLERKGLGILICGTGIGMSMAANKINGIRAALCTSEFQARATREHNNANVICLGERVTGPGLALSMVDLFLNTDFMGDRHLRRIRQFDNTL